jgi:hypothetical protein
MSAKGEEKLIKQLSEDLMKEINEEIKKQADKNLDDLVKSVFHRGCVLTSAFKVEIIDGSEKNTISGVIYSKTKRIEVGEDVVEFEYEPLYRTKDYVLSANACSFMYSDIKMRIFVECFQWLLEKMADDSI